MEVMDVTNPSTVAGISDNKKEGCCSIALSGSHEVTLIRVIVRPRAMGFEGDDGESQKTEDCTAEC